MIVYMPHTDLSINVTDEHDPVLEQFHNGNPAFNIADHLYTELKQAIISGKGKKFVQHGGIYHIQTAMNSNLIKRYTSYKKR